MQTLLKTLLIFFFVISASFAENNESSNSGDKWSFYTGTFDFSDEGKKSSLFGVQHINTD